jgi:integrase
VKRDRLKLNRTKTGPRTVMLSAEAKEVLDERRRERCSDFVFPSPFDPTRPRGSIHGAWKTIKRLADLPETLRLHDLRHTYASHAILAGESLYSTGKLLGHRAASSTETYAHLEGKVLAKVADEVAAKIERWMEG